MSPNNAVHRPLNARRFAQTQAIKTDIAETEVQTEKRLPEVGVNKMAQPPRIIEGRMHSRPQNHDLDCEDIKVSSWNEFGQLRHVIVGNAHGACIPKDEPATHFKFDPDKRAGMQAQFGPRPPETVASAQLQLDNLADLLASHGITVDRPDVIDWNQSIKTPMGWEVPCEFGVMPPRDVLLTIGNEIVEATMSWRSRYFEFRAYRNLLRKYWLNDPKMRWTAAPKPLLMEDSYQMGWLEDHEESDDTSKREKMDARDFVTRDWNEILFDAADTMRLGKDLIIQQGFSTNLAGVEWIRRQFPDHRIHCINFPGDPFPQHIDCTFVPLRPGLMLENPTRVIPEHQKVLFRDNGWEIISAPWSVYDRPAPLSCSSIWLSMNILVLDEKHVLYEAEETPMKEMLIKHGFEPIPINFRDAYPFGGALHCATADVFRDGECEDYFPNQTNAKLLNF